jgi:hypothetical protein
VTERRGGRDAAAGELTRENLGLLLAKASQRWNALLHQHLAPGPVVVWSHGKAIAPESGHFTRDTCVAWARVPE